MAYDRSMLELAGFSDEEIEELFRAHKDAERDKNENDIEKQSSPKPQNDIKKTKNQIVIDSIHKGHRQRVRDKFIKHGLEPFSEFEVLEFLLFFTIPYKDTNEIAHRLIEKFGSLQGVVDADYHDLVSVKGISEVSASLILMYHELFKYMRTQSPKRISLHKSHIAAEFCCNYFYNHLEECLIMLSLDATKKLKCLDVISKGTETETAYYPRKIIKLAIKNRANMVILAHNHPGDNPEPSTNDIMLTKHIADMLSAVHIDLIDHVICSGNKYTCLSEKDYL